MAVMPGPCSVDGCDKKAWSRGWCQMHYQRWRNHGTLEKPPPYPRPVRHSDELPCAVDGCDRGGTRVRGWCKLHYERWRKNGTTDTVRRTKTLGVCSFPDCGSPERQKGLCYGHLAQSRFKGELTPKRDQLPPKLCGFDGCDRKHSRLGWCGGHAWQFLNSSEPMRPLGQRRKKWRKVTEHGYVLVYRPDHPNAFKSGWVNEHTVVMSDLLGRPLVKPHENVHHLNGDRADNRPANLELWNTRQPRGQRVDDKIEWALELLRLYKPEALG